MTASEGMDAYIDAAAVNSAKGAYYAKDFDRVLAPRPVIFLFSFGPIVSTQCHRYRSSRYKFTVQVKISFHKEYHRIQNHTSSISLQSKSK